MKGSEIIIAVITWFVIGFISMIFVHLYDMRGEEFDENYFNDKCVDISVVIVLLGCLSPILILFAYLYDKIKGKKLITRFLYKIANIGIKE